VKQQSLDMLWHGDQPWFRLDQADAVEWLLSLPPESVDLFVTDPAYESLEKHRKNGTTTRLAHSKASSNDWFDIFPNERFEQLLPAMHRALRPDRHCYVMCDQETGFYLVELNRRLGIFTFHKAIIWDKKRIGMGYHYRARHEWILFFEKGKRKLNDLGVPDVLEFERVVGGYPTEKPVGLVETLIKQSTAEGEVVVDPFVGSGSAAEAALRCARRFHGCDVSYQATQLAGQRVSRWVQGVAQGGER